MNVVPLRGCWRSPGVGKLGLQRMARIVGKSISQYRHNEGRAPTEEQGNAGPRPYEMPEHHIVIIGAFITL